MRIVELYLDAFGPFSGRRLALGDPSEPGLCVVYGPNEAGKSSALRAIRGFFYGIPHQSEDNFIHRHQDLRVGARLCFGDGLSVELVRRKGTKQTLRGEGERGEEGVERLLALTHAIPETLFTHFYGLDHPALVEGSRALLEDGGELGRALFGAGLGVVHLRKVIEGLEAEAEALFVPRGHKQRIAVALGEWRDLQNEIRTSLLEPGKWEEQSRLVHEMDARLAALEKAIESTTIDLSRCRRLKELRQALAQAEEERQNALARIERESERERSLSLSPQILALAEPIEVLHQGLRAYRDIREQLPRREEAWAMLQSEIAASSMRLGSGWGDEPEPALRRIVERAPRVRELVADAARFEDRLEKALEAESQARGELARLARQEGAQDAGVRPRTEADPEPLARALSRALKLGPIDAQIDELGSQRAELARQCERLQDQLGLSGRPAGQIESLALPPQALIALHARRFADHDEESARLRQRQRTLQDERLAVTEELGRLRGEGSLPSEAELVAERKERDALWRALRTAWSAEGAPTAGETSHAIGERFEASLRRADQLADRLRSEADRVARGAAAAAHAARLDQELALLEQEGVRRADDRRALELAWQAIWPVELGGPGAPENRLAWRDGVDELLALLARRRELDGQLERERASRRAACLALRALVAPDELLGAEAGDRLESWIERAEAEHSRRRAERERDREQARVREQAGEALEQAVRRREQAQAALARWQETWRAELAAVALPQDARPRDAESHIDTIQRLLERRAKAAELSGRIAKMKADAQGFESECARLVASALPEIADFAADAAALRLKRELDQARDQATRADALRTAVAEARDQLAEAERRLAARADELRVLAARADAGGRSPGSPVVDEGVPSATGSTTGGDLELDLDLDRLSARIESLEARLRQQLDDKTDCAGALRVARAELAAMDGNSRIAELAERAEGRLAQIRGDVRRYAELRLARQILESEIDAYRRRNQGPLLEHAGQLFGELTHGAYPAVLSDAGEDGRARLVAVGHGGREVPVEGLSSGTRDQLFLALRLATLARSLERSEPMPLVADDILIEFDDDRTAATLEVLARFGQRTQILLFSHHRHVAELAGGLGDRARVVTL